MSSPDSIPPFPFERYFPLSMHDKLPDYEQEWNIIIIKLVITSVFFLVVVPSVLKVMYVQKRSKDGASSSNYGSPGTSTGTIPGGNSSSSATSKKKERRSKANKNSTEQNQLPSKSTCTSTQEDVPAYILILSNALYLLVMFAMVAFSPNNIKTSRRVYQAPLLKVEECQKIIDMANKAAARNAQSAQTELDSIRNDSSSSSNDRAAKLEQIITWPSGWKKDRHVSYPTTDLNVVLDFERTDLDFLSNLLHARLAPLLSKIYGISPDSIRANDMFVVRYDGYDVGNGNGQQSLNSHTDSSHVSFNVLLNDAFDGGGTRYYNRLMEGREGGIGGDGEKWYYDARPGVGDVLINNAMVNHEGLATTKGTRYIFVGFMNIDRINPWTKSKTNVPFYSTYLSLPWVSVILKSHLDDSIYNGSDGGGGNRGTRLSKRQQFDIIITATTWTMFLGDYFSPHGLIKLIENEEDDADNVAAMKYINALDEYYENYGDFMEKANWFKGQMIYINIDGTISSEWEEREEQREKFAEL